MGINKFFHIFMSISFIVIFGGCQSTIEDIQSNYRRVLYEDGINQTEALAIAQMRMTKMVYTKSFNADNPSVIKNEFSADYPNFWFITFPAQDVMSEVGYLIVLDRYTGGFIRSTEYNPDMQFTFGWLFD